MQHHGDASTNAYVAHLLHEQLVDRARGCLLGQLVGDALGSMVEFRSTEDIRSRYPDGLREIGPSPVWHTMAGQPTDDSELALALARTLVTTGVYADEQAINAYADWYASGPFDCGNTTRVACRARLDARRRGAPFSASQANSESQANGALMRQSPLAIWGCWLVPALLDAIVRADTRLTHPHQVCQDASAAYIVALAATVREGLSAEAAYARACEWDRVHGSSPIVAAALHAARSAPPSYQPNEGHVVIALQNAFYQALHVPTFEDGVAATVMGGGDTDTNAAIAGALLGAIHGLSAVPDQWRTAVLHCRPGPGDSSVRRPRPEMYWPVDALELAVRLLRAGIPWRPHSAGASQVAAPADDVAMPAANPCDDTPGAPLQVPPDHGGSPKQHVMVEIPGRPAGQRSRLPDRTRFRAALLGGGIGDALGRPVEGSRSPYFERTGRPITDYRAWHGYQSGPKGTITDDTQLTMVVAECLLANGRLDPADLARRLVDWLPIGRGKGQATVAAVERPRRACPGTWPVARTAPGMEPPCVPRQSGYCGSANQRCCVRKQR